MKSLSRMLSSGWNNIETHSSEETQQFAQRWGEELNAGALVLLQGGLGAGKTTFVKGLAKGIGLQDDRIVQSPTFTYLHIYEGGRCPLFHFDLYRIKNSEEFLSQGFEDFLEGTGICCIEWPDIIRPLLASPYWTVEFVHLSPDVRTLEIVYHG